MPQTSLTNMQPIKDKGCAIIVNVIVFVVGAMVVVPLWNFGFAERKAAGLARQISGYPEDHWRDVFLAAKQLHREVYRNTTIKVSADSMEPILAELGFATCTVYDHRVAFRFGGGHMLNSAGVVIELSDEPDGWSGVRIDGWKEYRDVYTHP